MDKIDRELIANKMVNELKKIINITGKIKKDKMKYSTAVQEMIVKLDENIVVYNNNITNKEFKINLEGCKLMEKYFQNTSEYFEFAKRKVLEEKPYLNEEELREFFSYINHFFDEDEENINDITQNTFIN